MHQWLRSHFSTQASRRIQAIAVSTLLAAGCGGSPAPVVESPANRESAPAVDSAAGALSSDTGNHGLAAPTAMLAAESPAVLSPATSTTRLIDPAAEAAFRKLISESISMEEFEQAQAELLQLGPAAAVVAASALSASNRFDREMASTILVMLGPDETGEVTPELLKALQDPSEFVRGNAATLLILTPDHGSKAAATLLDLLQTTDAGLRQLAAMNLQTQPEVAGAQLEKLLGALQQETEPAVIESLIDLLVQIGPSARQAEGLLKQLAESPDSNVSRSALQALEVLSQPIQPAQAEIP